MDNQMDKLYERLNFYMSAYEQTSNDLDTLKKEKTMIEDAIDTESKNILDEVLPNPLDGEQLSDIEKEFNMNLDDVIERHKTIKIMNESKIQQLKEDNRYKEYLNLLINDDLEICTKMENDETFLYLISENYNTDSFINEPYFEIWKFKYQPRLWKFKKIADKKSKEFGLNSFEEMYNLWNGLRINYKSLIRNKLIKDVIKECEAIEINIKELENIVENYLVARRFDIINCVTNRIKILGPDFIDDVKFSNLIPLLNSFVSLSKNEPGLQERKNVIMQNINTIENMINLVEQGKINIDDKKYEQFFINTNPETPIFELISESEWLEIKDALNKKGIKTSSKENYSVVRTKIPQKEKENLLKKYNVKEGEIFYDPSLANKR